MNITIEYPSTSICHVWYMTTAGGDGIALCFHALWSQVCAAHVAEIEVGSHPFSRVTGIFAGDDGPKPGRARSTTDLDTLSAPGGLKPCAILQEWVDFCDDVVFATAKHCSRGGPSHHRVRGVKQASPRSGELRGLLRDDLSLRPRSSSTHDQRRTDEVRLWTRPRA